MPDVNVSVAVDGKTVFVHGAIGTPDPNGAVINGLTAALGHFQAVASAAAQRQASPPSGLNVKGPSL